MTKERLNTYQSCKAEIAEIREELASIPADAENSRKTKLEEQCRKIEQEAQEIEQFISAIPDSMTRRIFRMRFQQGRTQGEVAERVHIDRSRVSRKIDGYLQNAHKAQKAQV